MGGFLCSSEEISIGIDLELGWFLRRVVSPPMQWWCQLLKARMEFKRQCEASAIRPGGPSEWTLTLALCIGLVCFPVSLLFYPQFLILASLLPPISDTCAWTSNYREILIIVGKENHLRGIDWFVCSYFCWVLTETKQSTRASRAALQWARRPEDDGRTTVGPEDAHHLFNKLLRQNTPVLAAQKSLQRRPCRRRCPLQPPVPICRGPLGGGTAHALHLHRCLPDDFSYSLVLKSFCSDRSQRALELLRMTWTHSWFPFASMEEARKLEIYLTPSLWRVRDQISSPTVFCFTCMLQTGEGSDRLHRVS
jgi:hypothetical protein